MSITDVPIGQTVTCAWCGAQEPRTTSESAMLEELAEVFGPGALDEALAVVCDTCWDKIQPPAGAVDG